MPIYTKNPKLKNTTAHAEKYYNPGNNPGEKIITGRLVDIRDKNGNFLNDQLIISEDSKKEPIIVGIINKEEKFINDSNKIEDIKAKIINYKLYTVHNNEIGSFNKNGNLTIYGQNNLKDEKIIIDKNGKLSGIILKQEGKKVTVDREGKKIPGLTLKERAKRIGSTLKKTLLKRQKDNREVAQEIAKQARKDKKTEIIRL